MAQRFISGLRCSYADYHPGRFVNRLLFEWLTQVVGWAVVDKYPGSKWDNVLGSGSGTAQSTTNALLQITSPSYVFTKADEGRFLTLTGFSSPAASGVYKILQFVGSVGSVYTVKIDIRQGVHHSGLPVQAGLNWRLWAGNDTYCPSDLDAAVVQGTGTTGAGLTTGTRSGVALSVSQGGSVSTLQDAGANFQASDVGKSITVSGSAVSGNNSTFTIASWISSTQITYTNASGGDDSWTGTWSITYPFHVWMQVADSPNPDYYDGFGKLDVSPFASWVAGVTHNWSDGRHTGKYGYLPWGGSSGYTQVTVWAEADLDHFSVFCIAENIGNYPSSIPLLYAAGEMDAIYPDSDPRPCWIWVGHDGVYEWYMGCFSGAGGAYPVIGTGSLPVGTNNPISGGIRALGFDDLTALTYYVTFPHSPGSTDANWVSQLKRLLSKFSGNFFRLPLIVECRTSGFMEMRGVLRNLWACASSLTLMSPHGANGEYLHALRGLMSVWNGARCPWPSTGYTPIG